MDRLPDYLDVGGDRLAFRVRTEESGDALVALDVRVPPGGGPPLLHRHAASELYRIGRGELAFYLGDEDGTIRRRVAGPGAVVSIAGGREHTIRNEGDEAAEAFVVFSPGAEMERFARATAARPEDVEAIAAAHGVEMTRPVPEGV